MDIQEILAVLLQFGEIDLVRRITGVLGRTADKPKEFAIVAMSYMNLGDYTEAIAFCEKAISGDDDEIKMNLPSRLYPAFKGVGDYPMALSIIESVIQFSNSVEAKIEKSSCLYEANKKSDALEVLESIDREKLNDQQKVKFDAAMGPHQLRSGRFQEGLKNVIMTQDMARQLQFGHQYHNAQELPLQFWKGTPDCKKLIVYLEAGIGDEFINLRFLKNLAEMGIDARLYNVFYEDPIKNKRRGLIEFYEKNGCKFIKHFDVEEYKDFQWTYSQYLPILLSVREKDLWRGPYIQAKQKRLKGKFKIGLRWSGNPVPKFRNFPLELVYNTLKDLDVTFYSLQKDVCMEELKEFPEIVDLSKKIPSLSDVADYINSMDLLITCPTVTCTIAGALDKECIVMTPCSDYYVFNTSNNKTPWFSNKMTLLRQKSARIWDDVMPDLRKLVEKKVNGGC